MKSLKIVVLVDSISYSSKDPDYLGLTARTRNNMEYFVSAALKKKHTVEVVPFHNSIDPLVQKMHSDRPDLVFNMVQYFNNDRRGEIYIPSILDVMGIRYTGPSSYGIMLTNDKKLCKDVLRQNGLPVPECTEVFKGEKIKAAALKFPVIVKPNFGGASDCISRNSIVRSPAQLDKAMQTIFKAGYLSVVIESFIAGKEVIVALVGNGGNVETYHPREVVFNESMKGEGIITKQIKERKKTRQKSNIYSRPLKASAKKREYIRQIAAKAFSVLKMSDYARLDMRMDDKGDVYIVDVNCNCNLRPGSRSFLKQFGNEKFETTIDKIIRHALRKTAGIPPQ